ncbi:MAG: 3-phosphoshikimate 1-carboxyvinyltransferase [Terrimicrobiaceae bacterium]|nr:3-phosphoshikimate 1-carboxyvinyltransferase [Terrimicrobiaceae bacterium]
MHFKIAKSSTIAAELTVPGDKSISHRAIMLGALTNGPCVITNFLEGEDCLATMAAMRKLGVRIEHPEAGAVVVHGAKGRFTQPASDLNCGNSGTTVRLLSGILAAQPFRTRMTGDASLSQRPMRRVIEPLTQMGARLTAEGARDTLPLIIDGGPLTGIRYEMPHASAQVKSAVLLAGLFASGKTTVVEPAPSRDHTERMLEYFQVRPVRQGSAVSVYGGQTLESRDFKVPGDISSAAFWLVAAAAQRGSRLRIGNVGLNPTRTGVLAVLVRMGARLREIVETAEGEPSGVIEIKGATLHGTMIDGDEIPNLIDEIPAIAVAAALASGKTTIRGASELRVKETDRIAAIASNLRAMGVAVAEFDDGMEITGGARLHGARLPSFGDHRIAMAFTIAGLFADEETIIEDVACVATSYPTFEETLRLVRSGKAIPRKSAAERGTVGASVRRTRAGTSL